MMAKTECRIMRNCTESSMNLERSDCYPTVLSHHAVDRFSASAVFVDMNPTGSQRKSCPNCGAGMWAGVVSVGDPHRSSYAFLACAW